MFMLKKKSTNFLFRLLFFYVLRDINLDFCSRPSATVGIHTTQKKKNLWASTDF